MLLFPLTLPPPLFCFSREGWVHLLVHIMELFADAALHLHLFKGFCVSSARTKQGQGMEGGSRQGMRGKEERGWGWGEGIFSV